MRATYCQRRDSKRNGRASKPAPTRRRLPLWVIAAALVLAFALGGRPMPEAVGAADGVGTRSVADSCEAPAGHALEAARAQRAIRMRERLQEHDRRRQAEVATFLQRKRAAQESLPLPDPPELATVIEAHFPGLHPRLAPGARP